MVSNDFSKDELCRQLPDSKNGDFEIIESNDIILTNIIIYYKKIEINHAVCKES